MVEDVLVIDVAGAANGSSSSETVVVDIGS